MMLFRSLLVLWGLCWSGLAAAGPGDGFGLGAGASPGGGEPVRVRVEASSETARPGDQLILAVVFEHDEGFHINPNKPVVPPEMEGFVPIPTTITPVLEEMDAAAGAEGAEGVGGLSFGRVQWPEPSVAEVDFLFTGEPVEFLVYAGTAVAFVPVRVDADAASGERSITLSVSYQACNDTTCLPPETVERTVRLRIGPDAPVSTDAGGLFAGFDPSVFADAGAWGGVLPDAGGVEPGAGERATNKFLGLVVLPDPGGPAGVLALALFAALGGFVLNLTPCVLPVIPIKVMTIAKHAGESRRRALMLGLWMAGGVVAFWASLGVLAVAVTGFTDPSRLFGFWWFTLAIGVLILVMGVGIMGLFQITLPQRVYAVNPRADSAGGSFLFGVMTAVLGLPCFGFVAGALLAGVAVMPAAVVMVIFASMGVGMALPYLVLAVFPGLVKRLPRTGPASELVKQVMGLLMIAAALYFIGSGVLALLSQTGASNRLPWWGRSVHWWAIALAMTAAGGWLAWRTVRITKKPVPRAAFSLLALVFVAAGVGAAVNRTEHLKNNFWVAYSPEGLAAALESGSVVVLDFTAEWCLNCKTLEATVLGRDPVKRELLSAGVVPMVADLTSNSAPGWEALRSLGQTGIPLLVVYSPERGPGRPAWMANAYSSEQVVRAIGQAKGIREATERRRDEATEG